MNLKRIIIAITVVLIGTGNINAQDMKTEVPKISDFPVGEENTGYAQYFTGKSWLAPLTTSKELNVPMSNVTFEPGCRNNWHSHTGGQLLIAVGGVGYYQERGKAARRLLPGDVVEIRSQRRTLARCRTRQLVLTPCHSVQSANESEHLA